MIIAEQQSWGKRIRKHLKWLITSVVVLGVITYFSYPVFLIYTTHTEPGVLNFDAEHRWRKSFISNGQFFSRGHHQSDEAARSGIYSNKVAAGKTMQYGVSGIFKNIVAGKHYRASVWYKTENEKGSVGLVVQGTSAEQFYLSTEEAVATEDDWKKLQLEIDIPGKFSNTELNIYVYTNGGCAVYFDDMRMEEIEEILSQQESEAKADTIVQFIAPKLQLQIKEKAMATLQAKRDAAFEKGILITDEDSWVKAVLSDDGEEVPVKIRLKGDWTDHLRQDKWSFRVQVKDPYSWNRLIVFSLQSPETRYYADEWLLHRFFEREDVLTTRYDFAQLSLNGKKLGTYAYEEHFDKQLLEYKSRREGPILRLVEDAMWAVRLRNGEEKYTDNHPAIAQSEVADIQPFKEGRTAENPKLKEDFEIARHLLYQYQHGLKKAADIFDLERMGRYFAICDVMGSGHGLIWHNQRFYYNPVISKLEPIGYDGYSNAPPPEPYLLGHGFIESSRPEYVSTLKNLVEDSDFLEHYYRNLEQFSSEDYLNALFSDLEEGLQARIAFLHQDFPKYNYNKEKLYNRAKAIRAKLHPFSEYSVKAYWKNQAQHPKTLILRNFHETPLMLVGTSTLKDRMLYPLEKPLYLADYYYGYSAKEVEAKVPADSRFIFYKSYGQDTIYTSEISSWSAYLQPIPAQEYQNQAPLVSNEVFTVDGPIIRFNRGLFVLTNDLIIPSGHRVLINAGTQLDFQKGAKFLSYSPVNIQGTSEEPVRIVSTDHSAHGFTVLQAGETSQLDYVIFDHFNTLQDRGWQLTGAVTFYESDVNLNNCIFENNHCEDGLNLIRSRFLMEEVTVRNTPSDGFDADFCEGTIRKSFFNDTGNDGVDVSGSNIKIIDCRMNRNGDKGISVGENSQMEIKYAEIDGAVIGVASKDLSYVLIDWIVLKNCNQGFAAYQKKPEYGPSIIDVRGYEEQKVKYLYTIAFGSKLHLGSKSIIGKR